MTMVIAETTTRKMEVELSMEELAEYGQASARLTLSLVEVVEEHSAQKKDFAAKEKGMVNEINRLSRSLAEGREMRDVECQVLRDYDAGTVTITRCDTGEKIEDRPFTQDEMTLPLPPNEDDVVTRMDAEAEARDAQDLPEGDGFTPGPDIRGQADRLRNALPDGEKEQNAEHSSETEEDRFNRLMGVTNDTEADASVDDGSEEEAPEEATDGTATDEAITDKPDAFNGGPSVETADKPKRSHKKKDRGEEPEL